MEEVVGQTGYVVHRSQERCPEVVKCDEQRDADTQQRPQFVELARDPQLPTRDLHESYTRTEQRDRTDEVDALEAVDDVEELSFPVADGTEVDHPVHRRVRQARVVVVLPSSEVEIAPRAN